MTNEGCHLPEVTSHSLENIGENYHGHRPSQTLLQSNKLRCAMNGKKMVTTEKLKYSIETIRNRAFAPLEHGLEFASGLLDYKE